MTGRFVSHVERFDITGPKPYRLKRMILYMRHTLIDFTLQVDKLHIKK